MIIKIGSWSAKEGLLMNVIFKEIRHGDIGKIRERIKKNPAIVNEVYTGTKPKKDIGQSPLQVAVKCGQFEIIDLLLDYGADPDFMENRAEQPADTENYYFMPMSVLHDALNGVFCSLPYGEFERAEKYIKLVETLLEKGADPNKATGLHPLLGTASLPLHTAVTKAYEVISQFAGSTYELNIKKYETAKRYLFQVLDLLTKYGADFDDWADSQTWSGETCRVAFINDFIPKEDKPYRIKYHGRNITGVSKGDVDQNKEIRMVIQQFIKLKL